MKTEYLIFVDGVRAHSSYSLEAHMNKLMYCLGLYGNSRVREQQVSY